jgi:hypothetical protein
MVRVRIGNKFAKKKLSARQLKKYVKFPSKIGPYFRKRTDFAPNFWVIDRRGRRQRRLVLKKNIKQYNFLVKQKAYVKPLLLLVEEGLDFVKSVPIKRVFSIRRATTAENVAPIGIKSEKITYFIDLRNKGFIYDQNFPPTKDKNFYVVLRQHFQQIPKRPSIFRIVANVINTLESIDGEVLREAFVSTSYSSDREELIDQLALRFELMLEGGTGSLIVDSEIENFIIEERIEPQAVVSMLQFR